MTSLRAYMMMMAPIGFASAQIPPETAQNVTVYHLNPRSAGALPVNMDTGDALGDLYFYLGEFLLPLECANQSAEGRSHFDCDNPERFGSDLVVTKVNMEVDTNYTAYSACNLCNGTDPFTGKSCEKGKYVCDCFSHHHSGESPCDPTKVGWENITEHFAPHTPTVKCANALNEACGKYKQDAKGCEFCLFMHYRSLEKEDECVDQDFQGFCPSQWGRCDENSSEWSCWAENIPRKTGGVWFSTLEEAKCSPTSAPGSCGWKVHSITTIKESCLKDVLMTTVESHDQAGCFHACGPRNQTSPCWIQCFFDTLLGVDARHSVTKPLGGMATADVEKSWTEAFKPKAEGGCEEVEIDYSWTDKFLPEHKLIV